MTKCCKNLNSCLGQEGAQERWEGKEDRGKETWRWENGVNEVRRELRQKGTQKKKKKDKAKENQDHHSSVVPSAPGSNPNHNIYTLNEEEKEIKEWRKWAVWPDVEINSTPNFSKICPKTNHNSFYLERMFFTIAQKST